MIPIHESSANRLVGSCLRRQDLPTLAFLLLLAFLLPPFLRTPLDCDPILFDLEARDVARGAVLYRDILENNTPLMVGIHHVVRSALGPSHEALRAVDLVVVGLGIAGVVFWLPRHRTGLRWITAFALTAFYLTSSEWCHVQRDVWLLAPVMAAMHLRRSHRCGAIGPRLLEGLIWGIACGLKPQIAVVALAVWFVSAWRARQCTGAPFLTIAVDAAATILGLAGVVEAGILIMQHLGIWEPYIIHLTTAVSDYAKADFYGPHGPWTYRFQFVIRMLPVSAVYLLAIPFAALCLVRMLAGQNRCEDYLLSAALVSWTVQAFALQHVFDYPHVAPMMLAIAFLARRMDTLGRLTPFAVVLLVSFLVAKGPFLIDRIAVWPTCLQRQIPPQLHDRLKQIDFVSWSELTAVANFLDGQSLGDRQLLIVADSAMPLWTMTDSRPPTRNYLFRNNWMAFPRQRERMLAEIETLPSLRFVVCDMSHLRWNPRPKRTACEWSEDWYGESRWADRVAFRSGRYAVIALNGREFRTWIRDVTDWEP